MPQKSRVVSNVIKGCLGNLIEWVDWFIYALFSISLSTLRLSRACSARSRYLLGPLYRC